MTIPESLEGLRVDFVAGTLGVGGAERQVYYKAKILSEAGARVRVLSLTSGQAYQKAIGELGIPVIYVGRFSSRILRLCTILRELRRDPPAIIHSVHFYTNLYASIPARILGIKDIGTVRTDLLFEIKTVPFFWKWSLNYPRFLTTNSREVVDKSHYFGMRRKPVYLLENGVDIEEFHPPGDKRKISGGSDSTVRIICVARMTEEKRTDLFLRVLAKIHQQAPFVRAKIVGDGPLRKGLQELSRQLGLGPDIVEFTGVIRDMPSVYQQADILILTSVFEGMPNVVLEAMACGLPVVATGAGSVPDIVSYGVTGYTVPISDTDGLIRHTLELVHNPALRQKMGIEARALVEKRFSLEALRQGLFSLYQSLLAV